MGNVLQSSYIDVHEAARSGHIDEVRYCLLTSLSCRKPLSPCRRSVIGRHSCGLVGVLQITLAYC